MAVCTDVTVRSIYTRVFPGTLCTLGRTQISLLNRFVLVLCEMYSQCKTRPRAPFHYTLSHSSLFIVSFKCCTSYLCPSPLLFLRSFPRGKRRRGVWATGVDAGGTRGGGGDSERGCALPALRHRYRGWGEVRFCAAEVTEGAFGTLLG